MQQSPDRNRQWPQSQFLYFYLFFLLISRAVARAALTTGYAPTIARHLWPERETTLTDSFVCFIWHVRSKLIMDSAQENRIVPWMSMSVLLFIIISIFY